MSTIVRVFPALLASLLLAAPARHPGSPLYAQFLIGDDGVELQFFGEQKSVNAWFEIEGLHVPPVEDALVVRAESAAGPLLAENVKITLDGVAVEAEVLEVAFEGPNPANPEPQLRVRARYAWDAPPERIGVEWGLFAPDTGGYRFPVLFRREGMDPLFTELSTVEPSYEWVSRGLAAPRGGTGGPIGAVAPGERVASRAWRLALGVFGVCGLVGAIVRSSRARIALVSLGVVGASATLVAGRTRAMPVVLPDDARALEIFTALHGRIYDAFTAESEDMIYELLASAVGDDAIDPLYGEIYESLVLRNEGGAFCRVELVEPLASTVRRFPEDDDPRFEVDHAWRVEGSVSHWGHEHRRTNAYRAIYTVTHDGEAWRIADWEVLEHRRADDGRSFVTLVGEEEEWGVDEDEFEEIDDLELQYANDE